MKIKVILSTTHHLQNGQVLLPPEVLLHLGSHRGQHVVGVHDDVDEGVQQTEEARVAARGELDTPPDGSGHDAMVDHVQRRHLVVSFAQHKEEGVKELGELGEEVPPTALGHPVSLGADPVHGFATQTVAGQPASGTSLVEDPHAEDHLDCIVDDKDASQLK